MSSKGEHAPEHVALIDRGRVRVDADGCLPALPPLGPEDEEHALADVLALVGAAIPVTPTARLADGRFVHFVGMRDVDASGAFVEPSDLGDPDLAAVVARACAELDPPRTPVLRPDWYRRGWFDRIESWIDAALAPLGRRRTGPVEPFRIWSISAVVQVPTDGGALWCKAPCAHFRNEARIHAALAPMLPELVPALVAVDAAEGWVLMEPLAGAEGSTRAAGAAAEAASRWAAAQLDTLEHVPLLLQAGLEHRGVDATVATFERVAAGSPERSMLTAAELAEVDAAVAPAIELIREFWAAGIPDSLAHGDLHLGNVAWDGRTMRIFDWTDGCISHPFLDGSHLVRFDGGSGARASATFVDAWHAAFPAVDVERVVALAPLADLAFQLVTFDRIAAATEAQSAWELGGVVARSLRALPALQHALRP